MPARVHEEEKEREVTEADFVTLFIIAVTFIVAFVLGYFALSWFIDWDFRRRERREK